MAAASSSAASKLMHLTFEVHGKVQKVFFRKHACEEAQRLGLVGFVSNTKNSTVIGEAVGPQQAIDQFRHWLRYTGSPQSSITDAKFDVKDAEESHGYIAFDVRRG